MRSTRFPLVCLAILIIHAPLHAQTPGYHVELTEDVNPLPPAKRAILVNDSEKTIEAFHLFAKCKTGPREAGSIQSGDDTLNFPVDFIGYPGLDGSVVKWNGSILARERLLLTPMLSGIPGCTWQANIDAVIYSDGTYEGDREAVRGLQAYRHGLVASLNLWTTRLHQSSDTSLSNIVDEAQMAKQQDEANGGIPQRDAIAYWYWLGRRHVDETVLGRLKNPTQSSRQPNPTDQYAHLVSEIERWQKKIDSNLALKKLEETFPLPHEITDQAAQSQASTPKQ